MNRTLHIHYVTPEKLGIGRSGTLTWFRPPTNREPSSMSSSGVQGPGGNLERARTEYHPGPAQSRDDFPSSSFVLAISPNFRLSIKTFPILFHVISHPLLCFVDIFCQAFQLSVVMFNVSEFGLSVN